MQNQHGFTLIEMMVTLAIAAIMITTGVPAFQHVVRTNRQAAQSAMLVRALQLARTEAIRRAANVTVCSGTATRGPNGGALCHDRRDWSSGWIVFVDNGKSDKLLHVFPGLEAGSKLISALGGKHSPMYSISYNGTGLSNTHGHFNLCGSDATMTAIDISNTGAIHAEQTSKSGPNTQCS